MSDKEGKEGKEVKLEVQVDDNVAQGIYANLSSVSHNETEFSIDFIFVQPQSNRARVRSRIISSPLHAKQLLMVLQENIKRYEQMFGAIRPAAARVEEKADKH